VRSWPARPMSCRSRSMGQRFGGDSDRRGAADGARWSCCRSRPWPSPWPCSVGRCWWADRGLGNRRLDSRFPSAKRSSESALPPGGTGMRRSTSPMSSRPRRSAHGRQTGPLSRRSGSIEITSAGSRSPSAPTPRLARPSWRSSSPTWGWWLSVSPGPPLSCRICSAGWASRSVRSFRSARGPRSPRAWSGSALASSARTDWPPSRSASPASGSA